MSYGRIDVNLLPPELQPGPAVRYAVILNVLIIAVTLAYIALDSVRGLTMLSYARQDRTALEDQIAAGQAIVADYGRLVEIRDKVQRYGRLVGLASADYVDMPVLLDRVARILPDGVYVDRVTNDKDNVSPEHTVVVFGLRASRRDPQLVLDALRAFKSDKLFSNCYMPTLNYEELTLQDLMQRSQVSWNVSGPDVPGDITAQQFSFEIRASVPRRLADLGLPKSLDDSALFASFLLPLPADTADALQPEQGTSPAAGNTGQAGSAAEQPPAGAAAETAAPGSPPAGVGVAEVH